MRKRKREDASKPRYDMPNMSAVLGESLPYTHPDADFPFARAYRRSRAAGRADGERRRG